MTGHKLGSGLNRFGLVLLLLLFALASGCSRANQPVQPRSVAGVLDLQGRQWASQGPVELNGQWEFYWHQLLEPSDFAGLTQPRPDRRWLEIPGTWNEDSPGDRTAPGDGFATLRLTVRAPRGNSGVMALHLPAVATSYRLWIDGRLAASVGVVAAEPDAAQPSYRPRVVYFHPQGETVDLTLQVANFSHREGGIRYPIEFGPATMVGEQTAHRIAVSLLLFGSLWALGLYHLVLAAGTRHRAALYFGLFCIAVGLRPLVVGENFLIRVIPWLPWEMMLNLEYLSMAVSLPTAALFMRELYPLEVARWATRVMTAVGALFSLLVIATPVRIYSHALLSYQVLLVTGSLYLLSRLLVAVAKRRPGALPTFLSTLVMGATMVLDILYYAGLSPVGDLSAYGMLFFLFSQALINSAEYARAFAAARRLSRELQELNRTLQEKVEERSQALMQSQRHEARTQAALSVIEERQRIAREIHHAVGHALTTVTILLEAARRLLRRDLNRAEEKLLTSQEIVREGLEEVRRAVHTLGAPPWEGDLQLAMMRLIRQTTDQTGLSVHCSIEPLEDLPIEQAEVFYHALQEGLTNGMRHGHSTRFHLSLSRLGQENSFTLTDNGQGGEQITYGFGLTALRDQVQALNGTLTVTSAPGQGTTLQVSLPNTSAG